MLSFTETPKASFTKTLSERSCATFDDFVAYLRTSRPRDEKDGPAIIPALFRPCPPVCRNKGLRNTKPCPGNAPHRLAANVASMTMFGIDIDDQTPEQLTAIFTRHVQMGHAFAAWETYSHTDAAPRWRLLVPFSEPLPLEDYRFWSKGRWPALARHFGVPDAIDRATKDAARLYYLPSWPTASVPREVVSQAGPLFNPRTVFTGALKHAPKLSFRPVPAEDLSRPVDIHLIRDKLAASKSQHVANLLRGKALTPPSSQPQRRHSHYEAWRSVTCSVANVLVGWESRQVVADSLLRASWRAEEAEEPNPGTSWDVVTALFNGACDKAPTYRAEREARDSVVLEEMLALSAARQRRVNERRRV